MFFSSCVQEICTFHSINHTVWQSSGILAVRRIGRPILLTFPTLNTMQCRHKTARPTWHIDTICTPPPARFSKLTSRRMLVQSYSAEVPSYDLRHNSCRDVMSRHLQVPLASVWKSQECRRSLDIQFKFLLSVHRTGRTTHSSDPRRCRVWHIASFFRLSCRYKDTNKELSLLTSTKHKQVASSLDFYKDTVKQVASSLDFYKDTVKQVASSLDFYKDTVKQ